MEKLSLSLPAMYGDHHVVEVRRILLEMPGVTEVYASSCFHLVEVTYDPAKIDPHAIEAKMSEAGYTQELPTPVEAGARGERQAAMRHTAAYEQAGQVVGFAQNVTYIARPLWMCPGIGVINDVDEER